MPQPTHYHGFPVGARVRLINRQNMAALIGEEAIVGRPEEYGQAAGSNYLYVQWQPRPDGGMTSQTHGGYQPTYFQLMQTEEEMAEEKKAKAAGIRLKAYSIMSRPLNSGVTQLQTLAYKQSKQDALKQASTYAANPSYAQLEIVVCEEIAILKRKEVPVEIIMVDDESEKVA